MKYRPLKKEEAREGLEVRYIFNDIQYRATILKIKEGDCNPYLVRLENGQVDIVKLKDLDLPIED